MSWQNVLGFFTGGLSNFFTGSGTDSANKFLSDPLGYGSKALSDELSKKQYDLAERQFAQGQANWEKEFGLQQDQFNYQKWYDQNNISLQMQQNAKYGINPLAANGSPTSTAVSASGSPQSPSAGSSPLPSSGAPILDLLGTLIGAKVSKDRADQQAELQRDALENEKSYQDGLLAVLGKRAQNETERTSTYKSSVDMSNEEIKTRIRDLEYELKYREDRDYANSSTNEVKNAKEAIKTAKDLAESGLSVKTVDDIQRNNAIVQAEKNSKNSPREHIDYEPSMVLSNPDYQKLAKEYARLGKYLSPHDYMVLVFHHEKRKTRAR